MKICDISGKWEYMTDESCTLGINDFRAEGTFSLPGTTCTNGIGKRRDY